MTQCVLKQNVGWCTGESLGSDTGLQARKKNLTERWRKKKRRYTKQGNRGKLTAQRQDADSRRKEGGNHKLRETGVTVKDNKGTNVRTRKKWREKTSFGRKSIDAKGAERRNLIQKRVLRRERRGEERKKVVDALKNTTELGALLNKRKGGHKTELKNLRTGPGIEVQ